MVNATEIVRSLKPDQIRKELADLEGERKALLTLLRAVLARESYKRRENQEVAQ